MFQYQYILFFRVGIGQEDSWICTYVLEIMSEVSYVMTSAHGKVQCRRQNLDEDGDWKLERNQRRRLSETD